MRRIVLAIVILPIVLITALPVSNVLLNEARLWVFADQLSELDELFERDFRVLATGSEVHHSGNSEYCSFTATRLYLHYESKESLGKIRNAINGRKFNAARNTTNKSPVDRLLNFSDGYLAVTLFDGPYDAWLDFRCW